MTHRDKERGHRSQHDDTYTEDAADHLPQKATTTTRPTFHVPQANRVTGFRKAVCSKEEMAKRVEYAVAGIVIGKGGNKFAEEIGAKYEVTRKTAFEYMRKAKELLHERARKEEEARAQNKKLGLGADDEEARKITNSAQGIHGFLQEVWVETADKVSKQFKDVVEPWQTALLDPIIPAIESACGLRDDYHGPRRFFITLPKSHAKTTKIALLATWGISFAPKHITVTCAAGDRSQAGFLLKAVEMIRRENPWLEQRFKIRVNKAAGIGGDLSIESCEAETKSGLLTDIIIVDELTFWAKKDLWDFLEDTATKRRTTVLIVITNAGILESWQHQIMVSAKANPEMWWVRDEPGTLASWLDRRAIEDAKKKRAPGHALRVYDNVWVRPDQEGSYLTREDVEACIDPALSEAQAGVRGFDYVLTMDYGSVKDRATAAISHYDPATKLVILDKLFIHQGSRAERTPISLMEEWAEWACENFYIAAFWLDPSQLEGVAQNFERKTDVKRFNFSGESHFKMAENFKNLVMNGRYRFYPGAGALTLKNGKTEDLKDELVALIQRSFGTQGLYRFDHHASMHDDRATVAALGAFAAVSLPVRHSAHDVLDAMLKGQEKPTVQRDDPGKGYREIRYLQQIRSWGAYPVFRTSPVCIADFPEEAEEYAADCAALAVNCAYELLGRSPVNEVPLARLGDAAVKRVRERVTARMRQMRLV